MSAQVTIDGKRYPLVESLGYQPGAGLTRIVKTVHGDRAVVKRGAVWTWWGRDDVIKPKSYYTGMSAAGGDK
jgi:hypothetical protein